MRDMLSVNGLWMVNGVVLKRVLTSIVMIAMEHSSQSISSPAMENVMRDMLSAMDGVILKSILTPQNGIVETDVFRSMNSVTEHALREEQSVEMIFASAAVMRIPTVIIIAWTTEIAMAPAPIRGIHALTIHACLDTFSATTSMIMIKMVILMITMTTIMINV